VSDSVLLTDSAESPVDEAAKLLDGWTVEHVSAGELSDAVASSQGG